MKLATQSGGVGIYDFDLEKDTLNFDEQNYKLYGIIKEDVHLTYSYWLSLIHPDDLELVVEQSKIAMSEKSELDIDFRIIWPDGKI